MEHFVAPALDFVAAHTGWAAVVVFVTAFGESFVFLSLLFPGTSILIAAGALISAGSLPYPPVLAAALVGLILGDGAAFWIGRRFGGAIGLLWPFRRNPGLLAGGIAFFERHGGKSVFIGRFFGPMRSIVPVTAGIMRMPSDRFWVANIVSAVIWAPIILFAGDVIGEIGSHLMGRANFFVVVIGGLLLFGAAGIAFALVRLRRQSRAAPLGQTPPAAQIGNDHPATRNR
jgi:undecaprenyl-diphosphatase